MATIDKVTILEKEFDSDGGGWKVQCTIETSNGIRSGQHWVDGKENMTDSNMKSALLAQYE